MANPDTQSTSPTTTTRNESANTPEPRCRVPQLGPDVPDALANAINHLEHALAPHPANTPEGPITRYEPIPKGASTRADQARQPPARMSPKCKGYTRP